jgi:D-serine dehydratase
LGIIFNLLHIHAYITKMSGCLILACAHRVIFYLGIMAICRSSALVQKVMSRFSQNVLGNNYVMLYRVLKKLAKIDQHMMSMRGAQRHACVLKVTVTISNIYNNYNLHYKIVMKHAANVGNTTTMCCATALTM